MASTVTQTPSMEHEAPLDSPASNTHTLTNPTDGTTLKTEGHQAEADTSPKGTKDAGPVRRNLVSPGSDMPNRPIVIPFEEAQRFQIHLETLITNALSVHQPFWPIFSTVLIMLDVGLTLSAIILGAVTVASAGSGAHVIQGLGIALTVVNGCLALMKGTGLPTSAYEFERRLDDFVNDAQDLRQECTLCTSPGRSPGWRMREKYGRPPRTIDEVVQETAEEHAKHVASLSALQLDFKAIRKALVLVGTTILNPAISEKVIKEAATPAKKE